MSDLSSENPDRLPRFAILATAALCLFAVFFVYASRLCGPNDLFRKDQSKTMAYTVDIILNHRFSLPRDPIFQPATKPPLYNWLAAAFVGPTGIYDEWAQKLPSILGALVIAKLISAWCRRNFVGEFGRSYALMLAMLAATIFIASRSTILLLYIARPDMVQAACLIAAWLAGNAALKFESKRDARPSATLFWLATTAAALAKGPAAVYPIVYVLVAAPLIFGDWRRLRNLHWILGLLTLFGAVGLWLACGARQDWPHVRDVLLGSEVAKRIIESRVEGGTKPWFYAVMWFVQQNTVWSYLMIGSMLVSLLGSVRRLVEARISGEQARRLHHVFDCLGIRATEGFFTGAAGAANLWAIIVVACLSIPKDKRQDFLLPGHPAAAILAAHFIVWLIVRHQWSRYALPMASAVFLLIEKKTVYEAKLPWSLLVAIASAGVFAVTMALLKYRPKLVPILAAIAVVGFVGFEVLTNTRLGTFKTSSTVSYVALMAGGGVVASLLIASFRKSRLEWPFVACGILFWAFALLQNSYKDTGLPSHDGGLLQCAIAHIFDPGRTSNGTNPSVYAARFAKQARQIVGDDKIVMLVRSKSPILTLMGRHQGSYLARQDFDSAKWVIAERTKFPALNDSPQEKLYSGKLDVDFGSIKGEGDIYKDRVALFHIEKGVPSVDEMISIHRWVTDWTTKDANPYRSANTGWIAGENDPPIWMPPAGDPWAIEDVKKRMSRGKDD
jgi:4-amino-4-deoxy-L-arabinose transferase-like glycosyltransferase